MDLESKSFGEFYRFDRSPIWDLHQDYFLNRGIQAWSKGEIPYSGVSNSVEAFKKALLFFENLKLSYKGTESVTVLEVGAGYGEFAKNFIEAFDLICEKSGSSFSKSLKYYISDFSAKTLTELQESKRLEKYQDRIEFLQLDILNPIKDYENSFDLIIANYVLDQFPARVLAHSKNNYFEKYLNLEISPQEFLKKNRHLKAQKFLKKLPMKIEFRKIDIENEIKEDHLEVLEQCFRGPKEVTVVYSYGSLKAINNLLKLLKQNGILLCSDFIASTRSGIDNYEPCYYGNSIAHPVNFEFILKYFSRASFNPEKSINEFKMEPALGQQAVLLYEDPLKPLHTLIITRPDFNQTLELGRIYKKVYYQNAFFRGLYRFLVEMKLSFFLFLIILLGFLCWQLYNQAANV